MLVRDHERPRLNERDGLTPDACVTDDTGIGKQSGSGGEVNIRNALR